MDRHLHLLKSGACAIYDKDKVTPGKAADGVQLCAMPMKELTKGNKLAVSTAALGVTLQLLGIESEPLETVISRQFKKKGHAVVTQNVAIARAGYDYAAQNFSAFSWKASKGAKPLGVITGNQAIAMGGAAAGVKFYAAYPMSPSTGVLMWMAAHARDLGIMVRQVEDEIGVMNMVIGAAHTGCRAMCATSGGGFALMTEAVGMAGMIETPIVCIDVQRAGPATGVPTKTEQGDLWQVLGAGQGDYPRIVAAPTSIADCFHTIPQIFDLADRFQCPGIVLADLLESEGFSSLDPAELDFNPPRDRGEVIGLNGQPVPSGEDYARYRETQSGVAPRAVPGTPGHAHVVATDEHDERGVLISDEFTDPHKRQAIMERRQRKMDGALPLIEAPRIAGSPDAEVTLVGWGSTWGVIGEAVEKLAREGIRANHLQIKWMVPLHVQAIQQALGKARRIVIVENNYSGQFARYLRSETGVVADAHIRKYDGEPFLPHHVVEGVRKVLAGKTKKYVPVHEIRV